MHAWWRVGFLVGYSLVAHLDLFLLFLQTCDCGDGCFLKLWELVLHWTATTSLTVKSFISKKGQENQEVIRKNQEPRYVL